MVKVSVIIPVYNVELFVGRCLDSVLTQTLTSIEIICVNDGSKDNSLSILEEYKSKDSRISILSKPNGGLGSARNTGISKATGEFVLFLDSDDWIKPNACELLYKTAKENRLDILQAKFECTYESGKTNIYNHFSTYPANKVLSGLEFFNVAKPISNFNWDKLWNREFFLKNNLQNLEGVYFEDAATTFKGLIYAKRVMYLDFPFHSYYQNPNSITGITFSKKHMRGRIYQFKAITELIDSHNLWNHKGVMFSLINIIDILLNQYTVIKKYNYSSRLLRYFIIKKRKLIRDQIGLRNSIKLDFKSFEIMWIPINIIIVKTIILFFLVKISPKFVIIFVKHSFLKIKNCF